MSLFSVFLIHEYTFVAVDHRSTFHKHGFLLVHFIPNDTFVHTVIIHQRDVKGTPSLLFMYCTDRMSTGISIRCLIGHKRLFAWYTKRHRVKKSDRTQETVSSFFCSVIFRIYAASVYSTCLPI